MSLGDKFKEFTSKNYADQGKAFLNAYWDQGADKKAEDVWKWQKVFAELDLDQGEEGSDLDEFQSHRFLEKLNEVKTVKEMRESLTAADLDFNKRLSLIEYALWKEGKTIEDFVGRPQGDPQSIIDAENAFKAVQAQLKEAQQKADEAAEAAKAAKAKEDDAKSKAQAARDSEAEAKAKAESSRKAEEEAKRTAQEAKEAAEEAAKKVKEAAEKEAELKAKEDEATAAADELKAALAELQAQQDAYDKKTEDLKKKTTEGGVVSQGRAKNELAQHLAEDPMPLSRAKITQEAATKRAEKSRQAAEDARVPATKAKEAAERAHQESEEAAAAAADAAKEAEAARVASEEAAAEAEAARVASEEAASAAEEARKEAERAQQASNDAVDECQNLLKEAEAKVEEAKKNAVQRGSVWWLDRQVAEAKLYMPKKKGGTWTAKV